MISCVLKTISRNRWNLTRWKRAETSKFLTGRGFPWRWPLVFLDPQDRIRRSTQVVFTVWDAPQSLRFQKSPLTAFNCLLCVHYVLISPGFNSQSEMMTRLLFRGSQKSSIVWMIASRKLPPLQFWHLLCNRELQMNAGQEGRERDQNQGRDTLGLNAALKTKWNSDAPTRRGS
jgi:hypothetical protein